MRCRREGLGVCQGAAAPVTLVGGCTSPTVIPAQGGTFTGTTSGTSVLAGSCSSSGSAPERVFQWTPTVSGTATIQTCGAGTSFDTVLYMRSGVCASGPEVAAGCNDDACPNSTGLFRASRITSSVTAGKTYFIVVDGFGLSQGNFTLTVTPPGASTTTTTTRPPTTTTTLRAAGGGCSSPTVIAAQGGTFSGTTSGTSTLAGSCGNSASSPERVYQWTPVVSGTATIQTCGAGTTFDTVLYMRSGACASGSQVSSGCNDDACPNASGLNRASRITPTVTAGQTYFIVVDGYSGAQGTFSLTVTPPGASTTTTLPRLTTTTTRPQTSTTTTTRPPSTTTTTSRSTTSTTTLPTTSPLELMGFVPGVGTPNDVAVNGLTGLAYVASREFGLSVMNVSNPRAPVAIGAANVPFYGQQVAVAGTLGAVSAAGMGLRVVDLSIPTAPRTVGWLSGTFSGVALVGQTAYALQTNASYTTDLVVVNLSVPAAPTIVGRVNVGAGADVTVVGSLAYVAAGGYGLKIVNVASPSAPTLVGTVDTPGTAVAVTVANGYAYVADWTAVRVVNVATPSRPVIVGSLATSATALALAGNRLYAVDGSLFKIIDVTTPTAPTVLSTNMGYGAQRIDVAGTVAYLASANLGGGQGGLSIWNVASPTAPALLVNLGDGANDLGVATAGSLAVAAAGSAGMKVISLSTPAAPRVLGTLNGFFTGVALVGQTAYALQTNASYSTDLVVVNLSVPAAPTIVGRVNVGAGGDIRVVGSLAYVAAGGYGLKFVNVASPTAPILVATLDTPGTAVEVAVANGYAYVADWTAVQVVNVTTPSRPVIVGSLATSATAVAVAGNRLYAVDGNQLKVIDVSTPTAPVLLTTAAGYGAQGIVISGTMAYLATPALTHGDVPTGGIYAFDVSSPTQPRLVHQLVVPGTIKKLALDPTFLYASDGSSIVDVIRP